MVAHDLRSPITVIAGFAELLSRDWADLHRGRADQVPEPDQRQRPQPLAARRRRPRGRGGRCRKVPARDPAVRPRSPRRADGAGAERCARAPSGSRSTSRRGSRPRSATRAATARSSRTWSPTRSSSRPTTRTSRSPSPSRKSMLAVERHRPRGRNPRGGHAEAVRAVLAPAATRGQVEGEGHRPRPLHLQAARRGAGRAGSRPRASPGSGRPSASPSRTPSRTARQA